MSTPCLIGYALEDKVYFAYCQTNGYPEHIIPILRTIPNSRGLAGYIVNAGEFPYLYEDKKIYPFENAKQHTCSLEEFINDETGIPNDYRYLYQNGKWKCYGFGPEYFDEKDWEELKQDCADLLVLDNRNEDGSYSFYNESVASDTPSGIVISFLIAFVLLVLCCIIHSNISYESKQSTSRSFDPYINGCNNAIFYSPEDYKIALKGTMISAYNEEMKFEYKGKEYVIKVKDVDKFIEFDKKRNK